MSPLPVKVTERLRFCRPHCICMRHLAKPLNDILPLLINGDDNLFSVGTELKRLYASSSSTTLVIACISSQLILCIHNRQAINFQLSAVHRPS